jgi:DNA-binding response OmpR family regulator
MAPMRLPVVAVINTSPDLTDMLRLVLEQHGFVAVSVLTYQIRDGVIDLNAFLTLHKPDVVIYDIGLPYASNWQLLCHLRESSPLGKLPVIVTTTNERQVRPLTADTPVHEIVGKPYDLNVLVELIRGALAGRPPGTQQKRQT